MVRIPVTNQGEDQSFGVYAIPGLGTHAFVGPFTSRREENSDGNDSSVGHCSETKEFDENDDESEPSCTPLCPMPCRQHRVDSSTSDDSNVTLLVTPTTGTKRWEGIAYKEARPIIANKVASRIREYFSLLNTPNDAGNYDWRGETLSKAEIEKRIEKLGLSAWNQSLNTSTYTTCSYTPRKLKLKPHQRTPPSICPNYRLILIPKKSVVF